jgi:TorA maturation chaperone TorD
MNMQTQPTSQATIQSSSWEGAPGAEEQRYRAGAYSLLASLLRTIPEQSTLEQVTQLASLNEQQDELSLAMHMLGLAAQGSSSQQLDDEFHALFIGLGRGELVPYGSWYLTGFLMEKPLAILRDDLATLGYERQNDIHEPEDHVAALCEVMTMLINDGKPLLTQQTFFEAHLATWLERFFTDLSEAKHAVFYRAVGRFGKAFIELEQQYLAMKG